MLDCQIAFAKCKKYETDIYGKNSKYAHRCKEKKTTLHLTPKTEQSEIAKLGAIHKMCKRHCEKYR